MSIDTATTLRLSRVIKADRKTVWAAWTEVDQMQQWMAPEGVDLAEVTADVTMGGSYHLRMVNPEGGEYNARGVYKEIDAPNRLVYTWQWDEPENDCGETLVTVELTELDGSTEVVITHDGFPVAEARDHHTTGWTSCLDRLVAIHN